MSDTTPGATALNLPDIAARVDGMRISGNVVGLALVQVANDAGSPMTLSGQVANSLLRRSFLPGFDATGVVAEDLGMPENCMPGVLLTGANITRLTAARTMMMGGSLVGALTPRGNFQKADMRDGDLRDWGGTGVFLEEADISGAKTNDGTDLTNAHLQDLKRTGVTLHAPSVIGADFGPDGVGKGQPRKAARIEAAKAIRASGELGN